MSAAAQAPSRGWLAPLFLALVSLGLYWPALNYAFVYDDWFLIANNESLRPALDDFGAAFDLFGKEYWEGVSPDKAEGMRAVGQALYRPLTLFVWACAAWAHGITATWPFHLISLLANVIVVLLLHRLVLRLFGQPRLAFVTALIFALHPVHSEAVAYIAGLSDLLSAAAVLGGLLLFVSLTRSPTRLAMGPWLGLLAVFFLGLLAKEQGLVLLGAVALTDLMLTLRGQRLSASSRLAVYGGLLAMLILHIVVRQAAIGQLEPDRSLISRLDNSLIGEDFGTRLLNGPTLIVRHLWLFLWPAALSIDYSYSTIPVLRSLAHPLALSALLLVLAMLLFGLLRLRRWPAVAFGLLFFLGATLPTSNILVPIGTIFGERLGYLPSVGLCLAAAALLDRVLADKRAAASAGLSTAGLLVIIALGGKMSLSTWERTKDYEEPVRLFESALEVVPQSARVHYQLGWIYGAQGLFTKAEEHFTRSLELDGQFAQAAVGLADTYKNARNFDKAIAVYDQLLRALEADGTGSSLTAGIRQTLYLQRAAAKMGKGDDAGAEADLQRAAQLGGQSAKAHVELARVLLNRGQSSEAVTHLRTAALLEPQNVNVLHEFARAASIANDDESFAQALAGLDALPRGKIMAQSIRAELLYDEAFRARDDVRRQQALEMFEAVRSAQPELAAPYIYRGRYLTEQGRYLDALIQFDNALERAPAHPLALLYKARAQNSANKPKEALITASELDRIRSDADSVSVLFEATLRLGDLEAMRVAAARLEALGRSATGLVNARSVDLRNAGRLDEALATIEAGRTLPGAADDPELLHNLAVLLLSAERFDEALHALDQQQRAQDLRAATQVEPLEDPFLHINRFRAFFGLGRYAEAAGELDVFEQSVDASTPAWASLLHRRAELLLQPGTPYFDPQRAAALCAEAAQHTRHTYPDAYDRWIEALIAAGDVPGAADCAQRASGHFPGQRRFQVAAAALQRAAAGEQAAALEMLEATQDLALGRLAAALRASAP
ncbi:MAG: tetratricopeptide repeat protein [Planctomycetota bacterium]